MMIDERCNWSGRGRSWVELGCMQLGRHVAIIAVSGSGTLSLYTDQAFDDCAHLHQGQIIDTLIRAELGRRSSSGPVNASVTRRGPRNRFHCFLLALLSQQSHRRTNLRRLNLVLLPSKPSPLTPGLLKLVPMQTVTFILTLIS